MARSAATKMPGRTCSMFRRQASSAATWLVALPAFTPISPRQKLHANERQQRRARDVAIHHAVGVAALDVVVVRRVLDVEVEIDVAPRAMPSPIGAHVDREERR